MVPHPKATVFATSPEEADRGALSIVADGILAADIPRIRVESVAALHYALAGKSYVAGAIDLSILKDHVQVHVYTEMHGGWLFSFPVEIVRTLANLPDSQFSGVAREWSLIFEDDGQPPMPGDVEMMLRQMVAIAKRRLTKAWGCIGSKKVVDGI